MCIEICSFRRRYTRKSPNFTKTANADRVRSTRVRGEYGPVAHVTDRPRSPAPRLGPRLPKRVARPLAPRHKGRARPKAGAKTELLSGLVAAAAASRVRLGGLHAVASDTLP